MRRKLAKCKVCNEMIPLKKFNNQAWKGIIKCPNGCTLTKMIVKRNTGEVEFM